MAEKTRQVTYSALMCAMIIVSTLWLKFPIPGTDVLFTTQVFFVLLCGHLLSPIYCLFSIGAYILLGLVGIPVFSATQGIAILVTPSFGYLLSFPFAAAAVSWIRARLKGKKGARIVATLAGIIVVYTIALPYIAILRGVYLATPVPLEVLFASYCFAFLPMDLVKGLLAALLAARLEKPLGLGR